MSQQRFVEQSVHAVECINSKCKTIIVLCICNSWQSYRAKLLCIIVCICYNTCTLLNEMSNERATFCSYKGECILRATLYMSNKFCTLCSATLARQQAWPMVPNSTLQPYQFAASTSLVERREFKRPPRAS